MKNGLLTLLIMMLVLPAIAPVFSHGVIHGFHDHHAAHHGQYDSYEHYHTIKQSVYHPAHFDITTYYSDYLHVDLQSLSQTVLKAPSLDDDKPQSLTIAAIAIPSSYDGLLNNQTRAPPDSMAYRFDIFPVYLSTQRLRI